MRTAPAVRLSNERRRQLNSLATGTGTPDRIARRARIVLRAAQGLRNLDIARQLGTTSASAGLWRRRFLSHGVAGITQDAPRPGRPPTIADSQVRSIIQATSYALSSGRRSPSARSMALQFGVSKSTVQRIWKEHGIRRPQGVAAPTGRQMDFLERVTDVVGLYLDPPERAIAFSTDERARPNPFHIGSSAFDSPRRRPNRGAQFRAFLQMTERETPPVLDIHMLLDSRWSPLPPEVAAWIRRHPRVHLHILPADRVGLTLVDRLIDGFSRRRDRPGASASAHRLKYAIREHRRRDQESGRPFVWTAASGDIRGAHGRLAIQQ